MTEVKYIRPELIEAIARNTLKNYDASLILGYEAKSVPIEDIIESMGLSLEFQYIRKNGRILGETVFDDDYVPIYNMDEKRYELIFVEALLSWMPACSDAEPKAGSVSPQLMSLLIG